MSPVPTTLGKMVAKFAAGVVGTSGKFAAGVVDNGGAPLLARYSGVGGKLIHEKNRKQKIS